MGNKFLSGSINSKQTNKNKQNETDKQTHKPNQNNTKNKSNKQTNKHYSYNKLCLSLPEFKLPEPFLYTRIYIYRGNVISVVHERQQHSSFSSKPTAFEEEARGLFIVLHLPCILRPFSRHRSF